MRFFKILYLPIMSCTWVSTKNQLYVLNIGYYSKNTKLN
ncbi:hypothetical protein yaldo0001_4160 [Yersinia aldovae ATCC 35236]|nr:hypothetical protein yaldo0001_4160 [Yersinia aldovae ATCC 35236]